MLYEDAYHVLRDTYLIFQPMALRLARSVLMGLTSKEIHLIHTAAVFVRLANQGHTALNLQDIDAHLVLLDHHQQLENYFAYPVQLERTLTLTPL